MFPLSVIFVLVRRYFIACSLEIKRIDAISKTIKNMIILT